MTAPALVLENVHKSFGATPILNGVTLTVDQGERHAIIGPNGAGKSTLFHVISGKLPATSGDIRLNGALITGMAPHRINRLGLARNFQVTNIFPRLSVYENLRCAAQWPMGYGYTFWRNVSRLRDLRERTEWILEEIGLSERRDIPAGVLTYAEQRALELGITIAGGAEMILLDEPTAGMSRPETERALQLIRNVTQNKTLLMIEHDMSVVFGLADRISVLVYGKVIASDTPARIRENPLVQEAYLGHEQVDAPKVRVTA